MLALFRLNRENKSCVSTSYSCLNSGHKTSKRDLVLTPIGNWRVNRTRTTGFTVMHITDTPMATIVLPLTFSASHLESCCCGTGGLRPVGSSKNEKLFSPLSPVSAARDSSIKQPVDSIPPESWGWSGSVREQRACVLLWGCPTVASVSLSRLSVTPPPAPLPFEPPPPPPLLLLCNIITSRRLWSLQSAARGSQMVVWSVSSSSEMSLSAIFCVCVCLFSVYCLSSCGMHEEDTLKTVAGDIFSNAVIRSTVLCEELHCLVLLGWTRGASKSPCSGSKTLTAIPHFLV